MILYHAMASLCLVPLALAFGMLTNRARWGLLKSVAVWLVLISPAVLFQPPGFFYRLPDPASAILTKRGDAPYVMGRDTLMVSVRTVATFRDETRGLRDIVWTLDHARAVLGAHGIRDSVLGSK